MPVNEKKDLFGIIEQICGLFLLFALSVFYIVLTFIGRGSKPSEEYTKKEIEKFYVSNDNDNDIFENKYEKQDNEYDFEDKVVTENELFVNNFDPLPKNETQNNNCDSIIDYFGHNDPNESRNNSKINLDMPFYENILRNKLYYQSDPLRGDVLINKHPIVPITSLTNDYTIPRYDTFFSKI